MRAILILLILVVVFGLAGCALPRWGMLLCVTHNDLPVIPEGKRVETRIDPRVKPGFLPYAGVKVLSNKAPGETLAWYRQEFEKRGWKLTPRSQQYNDWNDSGQENGQYHAERFRFLLGLPLARESLAMDMYSGATVRLWIRIDVDYLFAKPAEDALASLTAIGMGSLGNWGIPIIILCYPIVPVLWVS